MIAEEPSENYGMGWISLYRNIKNHWIFENDKWFKWWVLILFEVNHSESKITIGYNVHSLKKGQSAKSIRTWANLFNCGTKQATNFFNLLEKDEMITREILGKGKQSTTLINITNYSGYQDQEKRKRHSKGNEKETQEKRKRHTDNNDNNYNKVNKTIEDRKAEFKNSLSHFLNDFEKDLLNEFYKYWTEHGEKDRKMRFEKERSFNIKLRLEKWLKNSIEWKKEKSSAQKESAGDRLIKNVLGQ
jgi:hypothetical protein